jgi:F-type H+-transporting ATPase subunit gamma
MEMISAAKLNRYQDMMAKGQAYADNLAKLLARASRSGKLTVSHPFLEPREVKKTALVLITSDMGLCGSYNLELSHRARSVAGERGPGTVLIGIGKFGVRFLQRSNLSFHRTFSDLKAAGIETFLGELRGVLDELYSSGTVDAIDVLYGRCLSKSSYAYALERLLPLERPEAEASEIPGESHAEYIFEPDENTIFTRLIPLFFEAKVRQIFLESFVSEQIARMQAMHMATENASEMIDRLVIQRNKVRQAAITREIIEVVSGARALK